MREVKLHVENMHCDACVRRVRQALEKIDGVRVDDVRVGSARVEASEDVMEGALVAAVERAGYPATIEA